MQAEIQELEPQSESPLLEDGEQRPDEPHKWYRRFQRYCQLGPGRSLLRCYQLVMADRDARARAANGAPPRRSPKRSHTPAVWRRYAAQFEWDRRARAFDQAQKEQVEHTMHQALLTASGDLEEVRQFYLDLMRGWIRSPHGEMLPVTDIYQRRMAAKALQTLVSMLRTMQIGDESLQEIDEVEITEILVHQPQPDNNISRRGTVSDLPISDLPISDLPTHQPHQDQPDHQHSGRGTVSDLPVSNLPISDLPISNLPVSDLPTHQPHQDQPDHQHPGRGTVSNLPISNLPTHQPHQDQPDHQHSGRGTVSDLPVSNLPALSSS